MPWNSVYVYSVQWSSYQEKVEVLTRDDLTITVSATIIIRPIQNEIYDLEMEIGREVGIGCNPRLRGDWWKLNK
ncbi:hypothetical protein LEP1GSC017_1641 [Leptospira meyeri serovar Hardjo str. Went 5]|uniref:SPFH domain-containing protein n=1 Tax=Leptospira meyeri TaxID=29508 RepID=UPI00028E609D|nr:hypothetical protein LEP1GSC017_1641 [Leptospira meyeri serovar Hardjo str. Went 5]